MTRNVLIAGHPSPNSPLSYITVDLESATCHAAQSLMRRGFKTITLLMDQGRTQGILQTIAAFQKTCRAWPHQPIHADTMQTRIDLDSMRLSARRFAAHAKARQGVLIVAPISVSMIMTALLERGIAIPRDVEVVALDATPDSITVCPRFTHYPYPQHKVVKCFTDAVFHFFETGSLPRLRTVIPMEVLPSIKS